jgi:hypothetical protein
MITATVTNFSFQKITKIAIRQKSPLLKDLINSQEGGELCELLLTWKNKQMKAIEDNLTLDGIKDDFLAPLQILALTDESLEPLEQYAKQGNQEAQHLLVKWDAIMGKNLQKAVLDYRWLAANGHCGAYDDIKKYAEAGNPFFQCVYYSLKQDENMLINLFMNNKYARAFFFLTDFEFLHEAVALESHNDYILERLALFDNMEQHLAKNFKQPLNDRDKEQHSELWAWVYCLRILFAIQTRQQIKEKTWVQNPIDQVKLCNATTQKMIPLLVIHYNQYQNQWSNTQRQDFIRLLISLSTKTINTQKLCILQPPVLRDFNRILVHHLCGNKFGITFNSLTNVQQSKLITQANSGKKTDGKTLNKYLGCILTYCIDPKGRAKFDSNFFSHLPDLESDDEDEEIEDSQESSKQLSNGVSNSIRLCKSFLAKCK